MENSPFDPFSNLRLEHCDIAVTPIPSQRIGEILVRWTMLSRTYTRMQYLISIKSDRYRHVETRSFYDHKRVELIQIVCEISTTIIPVTTGIMQSPAKTCLLRSGYFKLFFPHAYTFV